MQNLPPWMLNPPRDLKGQTDLLLRKKKFLKSRGPKGKFLRQILKEVNEKTKFLQEQAKEAQPLNYFKPSYEQALLLNAWIWGIAFLCVYTSNRIGKTAACFVNFLLWAFPNNPKWRIFQPYIDEFGRYVKVYPRPDRDALQNITSALLHKPSTIPDPNPNLPPGDPKNQEVLHYVQKVCPSAFQEAWPNPPWNSGGTVWVGAPDQDHHEQVIWPLWKEYIPRSALDRYVPSEREITLNIRGPHRTTVWEIIGKSYESKETKWSSGAVDAIILTEGVKPNTLKEIKPRFKDPGIGSHDFTPAEPSNSGAASHLAEKIYKGSEVLPVRYHVWTGWHINLTPAHIMSPTKKKALIKSFEGDPEGKARVEGNFYASSALILSNLNREVHLLDWSKEELFQRFPRRQIYRSIDPGLDHPTAIMWAALLPTNAWVIYRVYSQAGLSISQRVEKCVELSNNRLAKKYWGKGPRDYYLIETHPNPNSEIPIFTVCDYHTFKEDEVTGQPFALNYQLAGLQIVESVHTGPEQRAIITNEYLRPSSFAPHILTNTPPGPRLYFLKNEYGVMSFILKMEEFYWDRKKAGEDKGQPKDKVPIHGDDELDTLGQLTASPYRWTNHQPSAILSGDSEPEPDLVSAAQIIQAHRPQHQHQHQQQQQLLHSVQNENQKDGFQLKPKREIVYFGEREE